MSQSIQDEIERELAGVEDALRRLDDGTYGTCEACGAPLDLLSLEKVPTARFCPSHGTPPPIGHPSPEVPDAPGRGGLPGLSRPAPG